MRIASMVLTSGLDLSTLPILLYVGPDLMLPLTSALAALAGLLLMFWQRFVGMLRSVGRLFKRSEKPRA